MSAALDRLRFGTDEPRPVATLLCAGPLTAELVEGNLRAIRWNGTEVLRAVAYVVRDRNWGTYLPTLRDLVVRQDADIFEVSFESCCRGAGNAGLVCRASITGRRDGTLTFAVDATPDADFETNRCGFCVLHPVVGLAGEPVMVEHGDGTVRHAVLPDAIEPWQPFKDIRALTHAVIPGLAATCRVAGDTFEMEDQRNWSDASYKTYVRPLALPWPYLLPGGVVQRQSVSLTLSGDTAPPGRDPLGAIRIELGAPVGTIPRFGLLVTPEETEAVLRHRARLAEVAPQVLLLHVDPVAGHGAAAMQGLAAVRQLCPRAEAVLECVVPGADDPREELAHMAASVREAGLQLDTITVSPSVDRQSTPPGSAWPACPPLEDIYAAARDAFPDLPLGGGMFSYFTELNRKRPPVALLDLVTHCTCPIVHAADDVSVMQSLESLPFIVRSARAIIGDRSYRIGPATMGMRQNPYGSRTYDNPANTRLTMTHADPRQRGLFAAAWMIGYIAATEDAGLDAFTGAALTGPFGLLSDAGDDGSVFPVFHAAKGLAALAGAHRFACRSSRPDQVLGVAAERDGRPLLWLANITDARQAIGVPSVFRQAAILDHDSWAAAARGSDPAAVPLGAGPLWLEPYAIARLEV